MKKNILLIETQSDNISSLSPLLNELENRNYNISIISNCNKIINEERGQDWKNKKIPCFLNLNNKFQLFIFLIIFPIITVISFFILIYLKFSKKINTIICSHYLEKLCFTKISKLLKINLIWLEFPNSVNTEKNKTLSWLLKKHSRFAKIIAFTEFSKEKLSKQGYKLENINIITPGIRQKNLQRQENIFGEIANNENNSKKRKFFTIGIVTELNHKKLGDKLEKFFQAIKKSLVIIPNMQIIVVGDGEERKNLTWLTKRMEIDNLVWFVGGPTLPNAGSQKHLKKWLDSFDLYFSVTNDIDLNDMHTLLHAMTTKLPIIAPENIGFETIIENQKNASLINTDNSETITQEIIRMQQSKTLRAEYGKNANTTAQNQFTIKKIADDIESLL